jgi:hypothetical protein
MRPGALNLVGRVLPREDSWKLVAAGLLIASAILHFQSAQFTGDLLDFGSFWESGRAVNDGNNPYGIYPRTHRPIEPPYANPNLNSPISLLLFAPLSRLDPHVGYIALWWTGLGVFIGVLMFLAWRYRLPDRPLLAAWTLALPALWNSLSLGQIYVFLLVPAVAGWVLMERGRPVAAGLAIGLVAAFKPNMLVWPALLFLSGHRREAFAATVSFAGCSLLPLFFFGTEVYTQWLDVLATDDPIRRAHFVNSSLSGVATRLGMSSVGIVVAAAILLLAAVFAFMRRPGKIETSAFAIALGTVASPLAWFHYLLFLLPALWSTDRWRLASVVGCAMLAVPIGVVGWSGVELAEHLPTAAWISGLTMQSFYSWAALLLAVGLAQNFVAAGPSHPSQDVVPTGWATSVKSNRDGSV